MPQAAPALVRDSPLLKGERVFLVSADKSMKSKVVNLDSGDGTVLLKMDHSSPVVAGGAAIFDRFGRLSGIAADAAARGRKLTVLAVCSEMVDVFTPMPDPYRSWPGTESFVGGCAGALPPAAWARLHWHWLTICGDDMKMGVQVSIDGSVVYRGQLAICKRPEPDSTARLAQLNFAVTRSDALRGKSSDAVESLECKIWQATSSTDDLGLGIWFTSNRRAYPVSTLIVRPGQEAVSKIDPGIVVRIFPISPH
jgi:hypothetical protein